MKKLFLIDGAAGAGKSDLIEFVQGKRHINANAVFKYTTRMERDKEEAKKSDLIFITEEEFEHYVQESNVNPVNKFYSYSYEGRRYGFFKKDIDVSIAEHENTFVIVRDISLISTLMIDYRTVAFTAHVYIYTDRSLVVERLRNDGFTEDAINFRLKRSEALWIDYVENYSFNMKVIINNSNKTDFHKGINAMIGELSRITENTDYLYVNPSLRFKLTKPLVGFRDVMLSKLDSYPYEKNVFLMMKFRDNNYDVYEYMRRELTSKGYNLVRADEPSWNITNNVYNPVAVLYCCKYGIALFDEPEKGAEYNPNVVYELGIMHYQGKECLILKNSKLKNVPFDLIKDLHKPYMREIQFHKILADWLVTIEYNHTL